MSTTLSNLNGNFKEVYAPTLINLIPEENLIQKHVKFDKESKLGGEYHQPVLVTRENGVTYAGPTEDDFTINAASGLTTQDAKLRGNQIVLAGKLGYKAIASSQTSKAAFVRATKLIVMGLMESASFRIEMSCLYGGMPIAAVSAVDGAKKVATLSNFAPASFVGLEGAKLDVYNATGATNRGSVTIDKVDAVGGKLTFTAALSSLVATDVLYFHGAKGKEMDGLATLLSKTGNDTLHGITVGDYSLWQPTKLTAFGEATFEKLLKAMKHPINKGLRGDVTVLCNPEVQLKLIADQDAKRRLDSSYKVSSNQQGAMGVRYEGPNGTIDITSHIHVKEGDMFVVRFSDFKRIGAADVGFLGQSGPDADDKFQLDSTTNGYNLRTYSDQALHCKKPACQMYITGVTVS